MPTKTKKKSSPANKIIVCISGGMVQAIRTTFDSKEIDLEIWDEDEPETIVKNHKLKNSREIDAHWAENISKEFPFVLL